MNRSRLRNATAALVCRATDLTDRFWRRLRPVPALQTGPRPLVRQKKKPTRYLGLRPPTLMIDLLFGALMLFAFHMGDPNARSVVRHDVDLPSSSKAADGKETKLLALVPVKSGGAWMYELINGTRIDVKTAIGIARQEKSRPVLVIAADTPVQSYLDAEMPFRKLGTRVGLAVRKEGDEK